MLDEVATMQNFKETIPRMAMKLYLLLRKVAGHIMCGNVLDKASLHFNIVSEPR